MKSRLFESIGAGRYAYPQVPVKIIGTFVVSVVKYQRMRLYSIMIGVILSLTPIAIGTALDATGFEPAPGFLTGTYAASYTTRPKSQYYRR
jgi:hypothetical protein